VGGRTIPASLNGSLVRDYIFNYGDVEFFVTDCRTTRSLDALNPVKFLLFLFFMT
jgi:hypothetical protein